jgi:hypothetical protein
VNVFYSTPGAYNEAKLKSNISFSVKTDDFFPYADCPHCYWTGYFTSRAALKRYVRVNSAYLNAARQLAVFGGGSLSPVFEEAMGLGTSLSGVVRLSCSFFNLKRTLLLFYFFILFFYRFNVS